MSSTKIAPLAVALAMALFAAAPARAAVVFEFESAAIDAFRNWTPPVSPEEPLSLAENTQGSTPGTEDIGRIDPSPQNSSLSSFAPASSFPIARAAGVPPTT